MKENTKIIRFVKTGFSLNFLAVICVISMLVLVEGCASSKSSKFCGCPSARGRR